MWRPLADERMVKFATFRELVPPDTLLRLGRLEQRKIKTKRLRSYRQRRTRKSQEIYWKKGRERLGRMERAGIVKRGMMMRLELARRSFDVAVRYQHTNL